MVQKSLDGGNAREPVEQALEQLVQEKDRKLNINWKHFHELDIHGDEDGWGKIIYSAATDKLLELGIFSLKSDKNYVLITYGPIILNPKTRQLSALYFTREQDAKLYKDVVLKNAQYHVGITQWRDVT